MTATDEGPREDSRIKKYRDSSRKAKVNTWKPIAKRCASIKENMVARTDALAMVSTLNRLKRREDDAVNNAVRDGKITKPEICEACGERGLIHGHHDDYSKKLEVRWLCAPCHGEVHRMQ